MHRTDQDRAAPLGSLATIYDIENCPRDDGGRLRDQGVIADAPDYDPRRFFSCSQCGKFWTVIELRRKQPSAAVRLSE